MLEEIINLLESEVQYHREKENTGTTSWDRGFENGSMTEALLLKTKIRSIVNAYANGG